MSSEKESSIALDLFRSPSRNTLLGAACLYIATCGVVNETSTYSSPPPATIMCEGEQQITIESPGATYQGLVESHVHTKSGDNLKSDKNLDAIAHAVVKGFNGKIMFAYPVDMTKNIIVSSDEVVVLPESCQPIA